MGLMACAFLAIDTAGVVTDAGLPHIVKLRLLTSVNLTGCKHITGALCGPLLVWGHAWEIRA